MRSPRSSSKAVARALRGLAAVIVSAAALIGPQAIGLAAAADPSCSDVEVVFARGTFEAPGVGATGQAFVDALNARLGGKTVEVYGVDYPASLDFQAAADGIVDAANKIETIAASCANTKIVLGGYDRARRWPATPPPTPSQTDGPARRPRRPVAAHDRLTRRGRGVVRHSVGRVPESGRSQRTVHHHREISTQRRPSRCALPETRFASPAVVTAPPTAPIKTMEWPTRPPISHSNG